MEAVGKHDFQATADDELSFKKGTILKVKRSPEMFWLCGPRTINTAGCNYCTVYFEN